MKPENSEEEVEPNKLTGETIYSELKQPNPEPEEVDNRPKVIVSQGRDARTGNMTNKYKVVPFIPGAVIERCGRKYILDKNGTQRRLKE